MEEFRCEQLRLLDFNEREESYCQIATQIESLAFIFGDPSFADTFIGVGARAFPEALTSLPEKEYGNRTGDYGKEVAKYLETCLGEGKMIACSGIVDIGGQNSETIERVSEAFRKHRKEENPVIRSLIIDRNMITPALRRCTQDIHYAVGDAYQFFSPDNIEFLHYLDESLGNEGSRLFIMNLNFGFIFL